MGLGMGIDGGPGAGMGLGLGGAGLMMRGGSPGVGMGLGDLGIDATREMSGSKLMEVEVMTSNSPPLGSPLSLAVEAQVFFMFSSSSF